MPPFAVRLEVSQVLAQLVARNLRNSLAVHINDNVNSSVGIFGIRSPSANNIRCQAPYVPD